MNSRDKRERTPAATQLSAGHFIRDLLAALNARSITWSNVCEYCPPQEFHRMARACSGANTVHYAHVMNWLLYVKGSRAVDLMKDGIGPAALSTLLKEARKQMKKANFRGQRRSWKRCFAVASIK